MSETTLILEQKIQVVEQLVGEVFYNLNLPTALRNAQKYAKNGGFVASMPQLLSWRVNNLDNNLWNTWYTANSEEDVGKTAQGTSVVIGVHGGGILIPKRIEKAYKQGLTPESAAKYTDAEIKALLNGKFPDNSTIPVYSFNEFKNGIKDLPNRYAVVMDFGEVKKTESSYQNIAGLYDNPLVIFRSGGVEQAAAHLDKVKKVYNTQKFGNWHPFKQIDPNQPQGRLLFLGDDFNDGLGGDSNLGNDGRFVGVAPEAPRARENTIGMPTLEQILAVINNPDLNREEMIQAVSKLYK